MIEIKETGFDKSRLSRTDEDIAEAKRLKAGFEAFSLIFLSNGIDVVPLTETFKLCQESLSYQLQSPLDIYFSLFYSATDEDMKSVMEGVNEFNRLSKERPTFGHKDFSRVVGYFVNRGYMRAVQKGLQRIIKSKG